jgi:hypothetical protein
MRQKHLTILYDMHLVLSDIEYIDGSLHSYTQLPHLSFVATLEQPLMSVLAFLRRGPKPRSARLHPPSLLDIPFDVYDKITGLPLKVNICGKEVAPVVSIPEGEYQPEGILA